MVQVNSSNSLSAQQLQALENTALGQYQSQTGTDFSKLMKQVDDVAQEGDQAPDATTQIGTATTISAKEGNSQLTGSFSVDALVAVGTFGANGKVNLFPEQQINAEYSALANASQASFSDSLQNFLTLSQQASPAGASGPSTFSDQEQFSIDGGLVSGNFDTSLSLKSAGGSMPTSS